MHSVCSLPTNLLLQGALKELAKFNAEYIFFSSLLDFFNVDEILCPHQSILNLYFSGLVFKKELRVKIRIINVIHEKKQLISIHKKISNQMLLANGNDQGWINSGKEKTSPHALINLRTCKTINHDIYTMSQTSHNFQET